MNIFTMMGLEYGTETSSNWARRKKGNENWINLFDGVQEY